MFMVRTNSIQCYIINGKVDLIRVPGFDFTRKFANCFESRYA